MSISTSTSNISNSFVQYILVFHCFFFVFTFSLLVINSIRMSIYRFLFLLFLCVLRIFSFELYSDFPQILEIWKLGINVDEQKKKKNWRENPMQKLHNLTRVLNILRIAICFTWMKLLFAFEVFCRFFCFCHFVFISLVFWKSYIIHFEASCSYI